MSFNRSILTTSVVVAAIGATACARTEARLIPAPIATDVPGPGNGASATVAGVQVVARTGAWQWTPRDLETKVTPILIELQSNADTPIQVRYNDLSLTDSQGHHFSVMPPYDIEGTVSVGYEVSNPFYGFDRFAVAPYLRRWYPRFSPYDGTFAYDSRYYSPYMTRYREIALPTVDMVQRALPEGVLSPGGKAMGFIYFETLDRDAGTVTLTMNLVDARSGESIGTASIPFVAH
jgi:hypothetical protein